MHSAAPMSGKHRHERHPEPALEVGLRAAQDDDPDVHDEEREQRPDVHELGDLAERDDGREGGDEQAEQSGDARRASCAGSSFASDRGSSPSRHIANVIRVWP